MDDSDYAGLPARINDIGRRLQTHADGEVAADARLLVDLVDDFHRTGLTRLTAMITQWRGDIFLDGVAGDAVTGTMLRSYGLVP